MANAELNVLRQVVEEGFAMADMNVIDQYVSAAYIEHQFGRNDGREVLKKSIQAISKAFSDRHYQLLHYAVTGDTVWGHYLFTGVHSGNFLGHEPTGKKVSIHVMDIVTIRGDQIVEHWGVPDRLALLVQIGAL